MSVNNLIIAKKLVGDAGRERNKAMQKLKQRERVFENMEIMEKEPDKFQLKNANAWAFEDVRALRYLPYGDVYWSMGHKKAAESENWNVIKRRLNAFSSLDPLYVKLYIMQDAMRGYSDDLSVKYPHENYGEAYDNAKTLLESLWQLFSDRKLPREIYDLIMAGKHETGILGPNYEACAKIMKMHDKEKTPLGPGQHWVGWGRRVV